MQPSAEQQQLIDSILAATSVEEGAAVVELAKQRGVAKAQVVHALEEARRRCGARGIHAGHEDLILDVLDRVVGWSRPELSIWSSDE